MATIGSLRTGMSFLYQGNFYELDFKEPKLGSDELRVYAKDFAKNEVTVLKLKPETPVDIVKTMIFGIVKVFPECSEDARAEVRRIRARTICDETIHTISVSQELYQAFSSLYAARKEINLVAYLQNGVISVVNFVETHQ